MNKKYLIILAAVIVVAFTGMVILSVISKNNEKKEEQTETVTEVVINTEEVTETESSKPETEEQTETNSELVKEINFTWNGQKEVWAILPTTGVPGLMIHADSMGYVMEKSGFKYVTKDAKGNPSKQVDFVEDAIAAGNVGALMIAAMDVEMLQDVVIKAQNAGIAVTMLGAEPTDYEVSGCVYTAYEITGMYAVQAAEDWLKVRATEEGSNIPVDEDGKYEVAIDYYTDISDGIYRSNAMIGTIDASDNLKLVSATQSYGDSAQTTAYDNAQAVLAAHPNCRIFIAYEPDEAMGIASAIEDFAETNKLDLADFCVVPCYSADDTFIAMWNEVKLNHSANAIKGYATYGDTASQDGIEDFAVNGKSTTGMESALDYLIKVKGYTLPQAVEKIAGRSMVTEPSYYFAPKPEKKQLVMPELEKYPYRAVGYLKSRGIHPEVIEYCIAHSMLFETSQYHNAVFVGYDKDGIAKYAAMRGTRSKYKGEVTGSDKHFSFSIMENPLSNQLHVFESAIDLMSYASLQIMDGRSCMFIL